MLEPTRDHDGVAVNTCHQVLLKCHLSLMRSVNLLQSRSLTFSVPSRKTAPMRCSPQSPPVTHISKLLSVRPRFQNKVASISIFPLTSPGSACLCLLSGAFFLLLLSLSISHLLSLSLFSLSIYLCIDLSIHLSQPRCLSLYISLCLPLYPLFSPEGTPWGSRYVCAASRKVSPRTEMSRTGSADVPFRDSRVCSITTSTSRSPGGAPVPL